MLNETSLEITKVSFNNKIVFTISNRKTKTSEDFVTFKEKLQK